MHMEKSMHINVCIPVKITHVKENRKKENKCLKNVCGHDDQVDYIYMYV